MNGFWQKYHQALIIGGLITVGLTILLLSGGEDSFSIVPPDYVSTPVSVAVNILSFVCCWFLASFSLSKFPVYKVLGVVALLFIASLAERHIHISRNPITIPLIILFWLGVASFLLPHFFRKYRIAILSVYGLVISYYFFDFIAFGYTENQRLNFASFMLAPLPVFAVLWGIEQWRWLRMLQADKAKAELALLKSQVNPHFFFNTLNNLYGLVVEKSNQAPEVVLKLSDMMRYTIYEGKEEWVNLTNEITYLETYIELHKIRYQKSVDIRFGHEVEKEMRIAPLLFIILLENAFKHGVESLTENAYIHLALTTKENQLFFTIENNYEPNPSIREGGIGLDNLKKRLTHIYPNRHELSIEQTNSTYKAHLSIRLSQDALL